MLIFPIYYLYFLNNFEKDNILNHTTIIWYKNNKINIIFIKFQLLT